jgi:hypothetical protein
MDLFTVLFHLLTLSISRDCGRPQDQPPHTTTPVRPRVSRRPCRDQVRRGRLQRHANPMPRSRCGTLNAAGAAARQTV